jgi:hypothetical protein
MPKGKQTQMISSSAVGRQGPVMHLRDGAKVIMILVVAESGGAAQSRG